MNLAFGDESFDVVTAFHVITVVPDPKRMLDEMVRVCRPGGRIVIINHFSSERALIRFVVDRVDPITRHLGWSTRLRLREVLDPGVLVLEKRYKTKPDFYAANYYEGVYMIAELLKRARAKGGDYVNGEAMKAALYADPKFDSVYGGQMVFQPNGVALKRVGLFKVEGDKNKFEKFVEVK